MVALRAPAPAHCTSRLASPISSVTTPGSADLCFVTAAAIEEVVADGNNIGLEGDTTPCNWVQTHENVMDPFHVFVLHSSNSGNQFVPLMGVLPEVSWEHTPLGVKSYQDRRLSDGKVFHRVTEVMMPTLRIVANPFVKRYGRTEALGGVELEVVHPVDLLARALRDA